jgi:hypothetical protein
MHTDEHGLERKNTRGRIHRLEADFFFYADLDSFLDFFLSVFIRVHPWFQIGSPRGGE